MRDLKIRDIQIGDVFSGDCVVTDYNTNHSMYIADDIFQQYGAYFLVYDVIHTGSKYRVLMAAFEDIETMKDKLSTKSEPLIGCELTSDEYPYSTNQYYTLKYVTEDYEYCGRVHLSSSMIDYVANAVMHVECSHLKVS